MQSHPQSLPPPRLLAILAAYGEPEPSLLKRIYGILAGLEATSQLLVVRNDVLERDGGEVGVPCVASSEGDEAKRGGQQEKNSGVSSDGIATTIIPGDNRQGEFSAWQTGMASAVSQEFKPDAFLLLTTAFPAAGPASMPVLHADIIRRLCDGTGMAGRLRRLPCHVPWQGTDLTEYVQTHCFLLTRESAEKLGNLVTFPDVDEFVYPEFRDAKRPAETGSRSSPLQRTPTTTGSDSRPPRFAPSPAFEATQGKPTSDLGHLTSLSSPPFRPHELWSHGFDDYLFHMLTQRWHGHGMPYTADNYPFFRRKVLSILNELTLTARVRSLGFQVLNLTPLPWLLDSPWLLPMPGRPIAVAQGVRNTIFRVAAQVSRNCHRLHR
ncbi:MAG: hypothetical protein WCN95_12215 [bacterium]